MQRGDVIGIFGDYDCDGVTSTALIRRALERRNVTPIVRLPSRLTEGYGLRLAQVDELANAGVQLLITVDTGVASVVEIAHAQARGMRVIVLDHHHLPSTLPGATAIVHPQLEPDFPLPHPSAAGVCYEFVRAWEQSRGQTAWPDWQTDAALGALGTVADVVELRGGNRLMVQLGLVALAQIKSGPLADLRTLAGIKGLVTSTDLAFRLAPRINAAGRMADPTLALAAIMGDATALARIEELNQSRQDLVRETVEGVLSAIDRSAPAYCLADAAYSPGICGLIAGRLTEATGRPSLVAHRRQDGLCTASLRSPAAYHIAEALARLSPLLLTHGGHAAAAGCTFMVEQWPELQDRLRADVLAHVDLAQLTPVTQYDAVLSPIDVQLSLIERLTALEPFGHGNPEPVFLLPAVRASDLRVVGRDGTHLQARFQGMKAIGFGFAPYASLLQGVTDVLVKLTINEWQNVRSPQAQIVDVRAA